MAPDVKAGIISVHYSHQIQIFSLFIERPKWRYDYQGVAQKCAFAPWIQVELQNLESSQLKIAKQFYLLINGALGR